MAADFRILILRHAIFLNPFIVFFSCILWFSRCPVMPCADVGDSVLPLQANADDCLLFSVYFPTVFDRSSNSGGNKSVFASFLTSVRVPHDSLWKRREAWTCVCEVIFPIQSFCDTPSCCCSTRNNKNKGNISFIKLNYRPMPSTEV